MPVEVTNQRKQPSLDATDTPVSSGDHRKRRRNRTMRSCINCHTSKRMCDRKRPCGRCTQLGLSGLCVFEVDDPSHGKGPDAELARLQSRVTELEGVIRDMKYKGRPRWIEPARIANSDAAAHRSSISSLVVDGNDSRETASSRAKQPQHQRAIPVVSSDVYTGYDSWAVTSSPSWPSNPSTSSASSPIAPCHPSDCRAHTTNSPLPSHNGPKTQPSSLPPAPASFFQELGSEGHLFAQLLNEVVDDETVPSRTEYRDSIHYCNCLNEPAIHAVIANLHPRIRKAEEVLSYSTHMSTCLLLRRLNEIDALVMTALRSTPDRARSWPAVAHFAERPLHHDSDCISPVVTPDAAQISAFGEQSPTPAYSLPPATQACVSQVDRPCQVLGEDPLMCWEPPSYYAECWGRTIQ